MYRENAIVTQRKTMHDVLDTLQNTPSSKWEGLYYAAGSHYYMWNKFKLYPDGEVAFDGDRIYNGSEAIKQLFQSIKDRKQTSAQQRAIEHLFGVQPEGE